MINKTKFSTITAVTATIAALAAMGSIGGGMGLGQQQIAFAQPVNLGQVRDAFSVADLEDDLEDAFGDIVNIGDPVQVPECGIFSAPFPIFVGGRLVGYQCIEVDGGFGTD